MGDKKIRIVTHLDYTDNDHKSLLQIVDKLPKQWQKLE